MIYGTFIGSGNPTAGAKLQDYYKTGGLSNTFPAAGHGCWHDDWCFLAQQQSGSLPLTRINDKPEIEPQTGIVIAFWGRIDNRDELIKQLAPAKPECTDASLILQAWLRWQRNSVMHLVGDFAFALYDPRHRSLFCTRDHMGVRPLYYLLNDHQVMFSTSLLALQESGCCSLEVDPKWLADYTLGLSMSYDRTAFQKVKKLPPGHYLYVDNNTSELCQYYQMQPDNQLQLKDSREYLEAYQAQLDEAVRCRLVQDDLQRPLGSELSGGIDSSTTTAYAAEMLPNPKEQLHTFAYASCEKEPQYINAVSQTIPMAATHIMNTHSDISRSRARTLAILGHPEEHPNASYHANIYQLAQKLDIRVLLSGFGGDEFVTNYSSLTLTELYNQKDYWRLQDFQRGDYFIIRFLRMIKFIQRQWRTEQQSNINPRFLPSCQMQWDNRLLKDCWLQQYNMRERLFTKARYDTGYSSLNEFSVDARRLSFLSTRMENCSLMAAANQLDYRWPLLDVRLINLFLSIPSTEKYYRGITRWLHRRAIDGRVPNMVTWKQGKDMGPSKSSGIGTGKACKMKGALHPMLQELIDPHRLEKIQALRNNASPGNLRVIRKTRGLRAIAALDQWLKEYY